jgi:saccharopine dehydrogenase (NAD+, L-lysine forming)
MQTSTGAILIVGGYGVVGGRIAADLAPDYPDQVMVAGRSVERAQAAAAALGHGARGRFIDIEQPASIDAALVGVRAVMSCIDQPGRLLLHAAIERGLRYTDITPHLCELGRGAAYEQIVARARACGARVVLGTGIVPGISNVMARVLAQTLGGADAIETALLLCATDVTGPASFDYFLQELAMPFEIHVDGADRAARAFSDPCPVEFPAPLGLRPAYLFPFSDQVLYPRTMGARTAVTRLAIEPTSLARGLAVALHFGAGRVMAWAPLRHAIARGRQGRLPQPGTVFALRVDVDHHGRSAHATLLGGAQADAAAAGAAAILRSLLDGQVAEPGAWMPEQVIDPPQFFSRLAARGLVVVQQVHAGFAAHQTCRPPPS